MGKLSKYKRWPSLKLYDAIGVPYIVTSDYWHGPLWTGVQMILSDKDGYGDSGFWHELAHWLAATPRQRKFPDFNLGKQVGGSAEVIACSGVSDYWEDCDCMDTLTCHKDCSIAKSREDRNIGWGDKPVSLKTATANEITACEALALYEPMVGLWSWGHRPIESEVNDTCFDFDGGSPYDLGNPDIQDKLYKKIVHPVLPEVSRKQVGGYLDNFVKGVYGSR